MSLSNIQYTDFSHTSLPQQKNPVKPPSGWNIFKAGFSDEIQAFKLAQAIFYQLERIFVKVLHYGLRAGLCSPTVNAAPHN